jgi:hypothetical protein
MMMGHTTGAAEEVVGRVGVQGVVKVKPIGCTDVECEQKRGKIKIKCKH